MELSVITLTWNSETYISSMLSSLIKGLEEINCDFEIIIVDNNSKDGTVKILNKYSKKYNNIKTYILSKNFGTTKPRNLAIKKAKYENILIVDSDTDFSDTDVLSLLNSFSKISSKKIGLIQPQLVHTDGTIQASALKFPTLGNKLARFLGKVNTPYDLKEIQTVDYCISAAWLLKKEIFNTVGLLDENIFYAPEDAEFCKRLWTKGLEVWYFPEVKITHHYQRMTSKKRFNKMWFLHLKGLIYFWLKKY
ncbi:MULTISPECIES: glycosyltransferase family 2 protein [Heyndrickxia]|uniref:glycosyltransferase family 2 protein n=1 Tax=Heyndrickxia TaxID=2837504 RepID=UPI002E1E52E5|nr:glycosyltransferase [Weizmannia sp. CD-2023]MED4866961.1 glycosyltransferase [Weizmannia sp. CD-2023]MED4890496.1 glycosyltransferase [Weizmannia sp. CD-2023]MED4921643.1 glycosyltransferase [Weizmannia sp. CD-2023]